MAKEEWYFLEGRERMGPVTETDIRKRLVAKLLTPRDLLWREGMDNWTRIDGIEEFMEQQRGSVPRPPGSGFRMDVGVPIMRGALKLFSSLFGGKFYEKLVRVVVPIAHCALLACLVFVLLLSIFGGEFQVSGLLIGLLLCAGILALQFVVSIFLGACSRAIENNKSSVTSRPVLDAVAVLGICGAIYFLVSGVLGIADNPKVAISYISFFSELVFAAACLGAACAGINPAITNTDIPDLQRDAGDEALGLAAYFSKIALVLAPLIFAFGVISLTVKLGIMGIGHAIGSMDSGVYIALWGYLEWLFSSSRGATAVGLQKLYEYMLSPAVLFFLFLAGWLVIRTLSAILVVPRKLDRVAGAPDGLDEFDDLESEENSDFEED